MTAGPSVHERLRIEVLCEACAAASRDEIARALWMEAARLYDRARVAAVLAHDKELRAEHNERTGGGGSGASLGVPTTQDGATDAWESSWIIEGR